MSKQETDCRKCGTSTGFFIMTSIDLVGDYHTVLCPDCRNAFHLYAEAHPSFVALLDAEAHTNILIARTCGDGVDRTAEIMRLNQRYRDLKSELFHISEAWVVGEDRA